MRYPIFGMVQLMLKIPKSVWFWKWDVDQSHVQELVLTTWQFKTAVIIPGTRHISWKKKHTQPCYQIPGAIPASHTTVHALLHSHSVWSDSGSSALPWPCDYLKICHPHHRLYQTGLKLGEIFIVIPTTHWKALKYIEIVIFGWYISLLMLQFQTHPPLSGADPLSRASPCSAHRRRCPLAHDVRLPRRSDRSSSSPTQRRNPRRVPGV